MKIKIRDIVIDSNSKVSILYASYNDPVKIKNELDKLILLWKNQVN